MAPVLRFVAGAWTFLWRQPALVRCVLALVFLPLLAEEYLDQPMAGERPEQTAVLVVLHVAVVVFLTWGIACVLTVGRRMLQAKAGRLRTSFNAVQGQARSLIVPLLLTDILRSCVTVLWGLPLIVAGVAFVAATDGMFDDLTWTQAFDAYPWLWGVLAAAVLLALPPLVYALRTSVSPFVVAYEKIAFRPALARSLALTKKRFGRTLAVVVLLGLLWLPGTIVDMLATEFAPAYAPLVMPPVNALFNAFALTLWLLGMTQYVKALGGKAKAPEGE